MKIIEKNELGNRTEREIMPGETVSFFGVVEKPTGTEQVIGLLVNDLDGTPYLNGCPVIDPMHT